MNAKEIGEEILFPSFFRKMLMSAFMSRFNANYLEKLRGYPIISLWIPIAFGKIYFFRMLLPTTKRVYRMDKIDDLKSHVFFKTAPNTVQDVANAE